MAFVFLTSSFMFTSVTFYHNRNNPGDLLYIIISRVETAVNVPSQTLLPSMVTLPQAPTTDKLKSR